MEGTTESNEYILAAGSCYIANTNENTVKVPQLRFGADAALGYVGWMMCSSLAQLAYASLSGFLGTLFYTQPHPATAF